MGVAWAGAHEDWVLMLGWWQGVLWGAALGEWWEGLEGHRGSSSEREQG